MEKTLSLLLIIGLGLALKGKIKSPDHLKGLKILILSVALPATIFAALLDVKAETSMLLLPVLGLSINMALFLLFHFFLERILKISDERKRTILMLMPSLAPGLSCFPFISEYLGTEALAMAALADVGNKIFVLIILYMIAMNWYYRNIEIQNGPKANQLKELLLALVKEPINMVIILALILLSFGVNMDALPTMISSSILRLASIMAPLVLLFIGMAVKIRKNDLGLILRVLFLRSGLSFLFCAVILLFIPRPEAVTTLLLLVFAQSSTSFWPFAHISLVNELEKAHLKKSFDHDLALSILALSLPFSTFIILGILSFPPISAQPMFPVAAGVIFLLLSLVKPLLERVKSLKSMKANKKEISHQTTSFQS